MIFQLVAPLSTEGTNNRTPPLFKCGNQSGKPSSSTMLFFMKIFLQRFPPPPRNHRISEQLFKHEHHGQGDLRWRQVARLPSAASHPWIQTVNARSPAREARAFLPRSVPSPRIASLLPKLDEKAVRPREIPAAIRNSGSQFPYRKGPQSGPFPLRCVQKGEFTGGNAVPAGRRPRRWPPAARLRSPRQL